MEISAADSDVERRKRWDRGFKVSDGIVCVNVGASAVGGSYLPENFKLMNIYFNAQTHLTDWMKT
jgi:hypothetical protein